MLLLLLPKLCVQLLVATTASGAVLSVSMAHVTDANMDTVKVHILGPHVTIHAVAGVVIAIGTRDWVLLTNTRFTDTPTMPRPPSGHLSPSIGGQFMPTMTPLASTLLPHGMQVIQMGDWRMGKLPCVALMYRGRVRVMNATTLASELLRDLEGRDIDRYVGTNNVACFVFKNEPYIGSIFRVHPDEHLEHVKHKQVLYTWQLEHPPVRRLLSDAGLLCDHLEVIGAAGHMVCTACDCAVHPCA